MLGSCFEGQPQHRKMEMMLQTNSNCSKQNENLNLLASLCSGETGAEVVKQSRLHLNSCNMEEAVITVAIAKQVLFRTAGQERISCSLASRQGAMNTLIRSVCSASTHVCGLWTLQNRCLSHTELPNTARSPDSSLRTRKPYSDVCEYIIKH